MGENTKIEWCHHSWNPWMGCQKVSPGCDHCYAEALSKRTGLAKWGPGAPRRLTSDGYWKQPLRWDAKARDAGERRRVFCASMADVFDNAAPDGARDRLWPLIRQTPGLDWLLLTKRPQNIARMLPGDWAGGYLNVWLGTTAENQAEANRRIPHLLSVPARVHFLSCEPLIGPVDLTAARNGWSALVAPCAGGTRVGWVIAGGESGPKARAMHPDWARSLRDQCKADGVPFHFKQWGSWAPPDAAGELPLPLPQPGSAKQLVRLPKARAGRTLDGAVWDGVPAP